MARSVIPCAALAILWTSFGVHILEADQRTPEPAGIADADVFRQLVAVPYDPREVEHLREIWPERYRPGIGQVWSYRANPAAPPTFYFMGEFRIVNWNAAGGYPNGSNAYTPPGDVARPVLEQVDRFNANVITLQEAREDVYFELREGLLARSYQWTCDAHEFGARADLRITCVKGPTTNLRVKRLANAGPLNYQGYKNREWWGYLQVDFFGVTITNVHTRNHWDVEHVCQLHREVTTGIVAGDFNHETPEQASACGPAWFQTDANQLITLWTLNQKVDHVLTVEPHGQAHAELAGSHGSNHEMLLTRFRFLVPFERRATIQGSGDVSVPSLFRN